MALPAEATSTREDSEVVISVVVPMYNEQDTLNEFFRRVEATLEAITPRYEIICVDDGSSDGTLHRLLDHNRRNPRIKIVSLSRNFGKDAALSAGLDLAEGEAIIPIDSDLQDPPELISDMVRRWRDGFDVVYAKRGAREGETALKRLTARMFYRLHNLVADLGIPEDTGDFRLIDRKVLAALRTMPERTRFMKGLFTWVGFRQTGVEYRRQPRAAGSTKWKYWRLWNFALDGITSSTTLPLRIWTYVGVTIATLSMLYGASLIIRTLLFGRDVPGYASIMAAVLFLGGVNIVATGIIGEYVGRVFNEVRERPLYIIRERRGFGDANYPGEQWNAKYSNGSRPLKKNIGGS
jgi:glycosyltransferase involved in cell wall biosynthesis